jgi:hypothetical protein
MSTYFLWALGLLMAGLFLVFGGAQWLLGRRPRLRVTRALDCGCPDDGRPVYGCLTCGHTQCAEHRFDYCNDKFSTHGETP